jgi:hypothetical protein
MFPSIASFSGGSLKQKKHMGLRRSGKKTEPKRAKLEGGSAMIRNKLCGGTVQGSLCSYPISVEEGPEGRYEYKDNNPRSANYGTDIHVCPRCGERFYFWTEHSDQVYPRW